MAEAVRNTPGTTFLDATSVAYAYEPDDDIASITHAYSGGSLVLGYAHNGAHQVNQVAVSDATLVNSDLQASSSYATNSLNQYTQAGSATLTYDSNGNLTGDGTWTYKYDEENQLREAVGPSVTADYAYDADGRRRSKSVNGTIAYFISDGPNELAELGGTGTRLRFYVNANGPDARIATNDDAGGTGLAFYHTNHQGSVVLTTAYSGGTIREKYRYDAYGLPASGDASTGNPIRYAGRYADAETGLYYYRARYYSTRWGRFLQADPIGMKNDPNLYLYADDDPLDRSDPSGLADKSPSVPASCTGSRIGDACGKFGNTPAATPIARAKAKVTSNPLPNREINRKNGSTADGRFDPKGNNRTNSDGSPRAHSGIDLGAPVGTEVHAAGDGTAVTTADTKGYGNQIEIYHGDDVLTRYGHLSAFNVPDHAKVKAGDVIGKVGTTAGIKDGRLVSIPGQAHLHFEIMVGSLPVDPQSVMHFEVQQ